MRMIPLVQMVSLYMKKRKQGPLSPRCLAQNIRQIPAEGAIACFKGSVRCLAACGIFAAEVTGVVDGTGIETTHQYAGHGTLAVVAQQTLRVSETLIRVDAGTACVYPEGTACVYPAGVFG